MSDIKQPRADSKLKRLDLAVMREVVALCDKPQQTLADVIAWLKAERGVSSSVTALSQDLPFLRARVKSAEREAKIEAWLETEKLEHPELSDEELFRRGQRKFSLLTIAEEDPKGWAMIQKTQRDKEGISLDRQKFQRETCELFLRWAADQRASAIASSTDSNADKIAKLGELMFGEDWKS